MRFFFPQELEYFLKQAGFSLQSLTPFPLLEGKVDERTWNTSAVAQKK
jgi:hypothetical protein